LLTSRVGSANYNLFDVNPVYTTAYRQKAMLEGRRYNFGGRVEF